MASFGALVGQGSPDPQDVPGAYPAVLALHGFTGTPVEVEIVVQVARELGLRVSAPLLPGHGTHARDLAPKRFDDWLGAANAAFEKLLHARSDADQPVIVAGLSMGALLALELALRNPELVRGVILLSPALALHWPYPDLPLALVGKLHVPDFWMPKGGPDLGDPFERRRHLNYNAQPIHAALSIRDAGRRLRRRASELRAPLFVAHGKQDQVCPHKYAERFVAEASSRDKTLLLLRKSHHILTRDVERARVRRGLSEFIAKLTNRPTSAPEEALHESTRTPVEP